jgi:hypothetical protein
MHPWRIVSLVGAGFAALSLPFPYVTLPALGAIDGVEAVAWPALLPLAPLLLAAIAGDRRRGLRPLGVLAALVAAAAAVLFASLKLSDAILAVRGAAGGALGSGGFVLLGGTLVCLGGAATAAVRP